VRELFEDIRSKEDGELSVTKGTWYNGNAYLPNVKYVLKFSYHSAEIYIDYETFKSEFSKPSSADLGAFGDRHICHWTCRIQDTLLPDFRIEPRSYFKRIFDKNSEIKFKVECKDEMLSSFMYRNKELIRLFGISESSPEFSPQLIGKAESKGYTISINYNTQGEYKSIIYSAISFCKELIEAFGT
tara:strand:+ start:47763 stop:48320 length:558 start_codon:yes stop_codon:yes gene_type:complete